MPEPTPSADRAPGGAADSAEPADAHERFVRAMSRHDRPLRSYLFTLLLADDAVDEVMQETCLDRLAEVRRVRRDAAVLPLGLPNRLRQDAEASPPPRPPDVQRSHSRKDPNGKDPNGKDHSGKDHSRWAAVAGGLAIVTSILVAVTLLRPSGPEPDQIAEVTEKGPSANWGEAEVAEATLAGHAVLRLESAAAWKSTIAPQIGRPIGPGPLTLTSGDAQIDMFCGATLTLSGPVEIDILSDWAIACRSGRLRARVPPSARGFTIETRAADIIDEGTEFGLVVDSGLTELRVIDGAVRVRDRQARTTAPIETVYRTGEVQRFGHDGVPDRVDPDLGDPDRGDHADRAEATIPIERSLQTDTAAESVRRLAGWRRTAAELAGDDRLIAYYPLDGPSLADRSLPNLARSGATATADAVGFPQPATDRFGRLDGAVGFARPGSRLRFRCDAELPALTLTAWVRIDALVNEYNALLLSDGYEPGEPHWQIRRDGRLMLSVMAGDAPRSPTATLPWFVQREPWHRVYYSPPIWTPADAGRWMHVASVFDPVSRRVRHYVDGRRVADHWMEARTLVETIRLGNAEIGNWGQPFRPAADFAVRNLHGAIDDLMIWRVALGPHEIEALANETRGQSVEPFRRLEEPKGDAKPLMRK